LLIHGVGMEKSGWMFQTGPISKAGFTVYAYDVRGFGKSTQIEFPDDEVKASNFYLIEKEIVQSIFYK